MLMIRRWNAPVHALRAGCLGDGWWYVQCDGAGLSERRTKREELIALVRE